MRILMASRESTPVRLSYTAQPRMPTVRAVSWRTGRGCALAALLLVFPVSARAETSSDKPAWSDWLGGDLDGLRPALVRYGLSFGLSETTEVLGNTAGGSRRTAIVEGLTQMSLGADLYKTLGINGLTLNASAFQIHGRGLSPNLGVLDVVSSIEADPATRLNELWLQQAFGIVDVKIGQQSADLEFITSEYEDLFINSGFGWPTLPAIDLPSGGPAYPLATPGVRLRARPDQQITALVGVFNGSPAGLRPGDPQQIDATGTRFDVSSGTFVIGEVQYTTKSDTKTHPGTYKIGAWYNSNAFADPFFVNAASPALSGPLTPSPGQRRGDWSVYGTLDQVFAPSGEGAGGLAFTARAMAAPASRNVVDVFLQGGLTYKGPFGRPDDNVGAAVEWAHVGSRARQGDAAANAASPTPIERRTAETVFEATYQTQVTSWWQIQPDLQVVLRPGGGIPDPDHPKARLGDAVILGVRSVVTF